jgi:hypothetical protein
MRPSETETVERNNTKQEYEDELLNIIWHNIKVM